MFYSGGREFLFCERLLCLLTGRTCIIWNKFELQIRQKNDYYFIFTNCDCALQHINLKIRLLMSPRSLIAPARCFFYPVRRSWFQTCGRFLLSSIFCIPSMPTITPSTLNDFFQAIVLSKTLESADYCLSRHIFNCKASSGPARPR